MQRYEMFQKGETNGQNLLRGVGCREMSFEQKRGEGVSCLLCESALIKCVGGMLGKLNILSYDC